MTQPASMFLPIFILLLVALTVGCVVLVLSGVILPKLKPNNPSGLKLSPFECGAPSLQEGARHRYSVKFYLTAMLFILFDVEAAFLLPWAVQYKTHLSTFIPFLTFFVTLLIGYAYVWGKGALEWER